MADQQNVYVAGGFNVNSITHRPYVVADLQLFNQITQRWQFLTTIPNLELSHELLFYDNKLHVIETIELSDETQITNILRSFDLQKLTWIDTKNSTDGDRKPNRQKPVEKIPSSSSLTVSSDADRFETTKLKRNAPVIYLVLEFFFNQYSFMFCIGQ